MWKGWQISAGSDEGLSNVTSSKTHETHPTRTHTQDPTYIRIPRPLPARSKFQAPNPSQDAPPRPCMFPHIPSEGIPTVLLMEPMGLTSADEQSYLVK